MSTNTNQADWTELKGKIKAKWGKFIETELESFKGNMHLIVEKVQKSYGLTKDKAELEYAEFTKTLGAQPTKTKGPGPQPVVEAVLKAN